MPLGQFGSLGEWLGWYAKKRPIVYFGFFVW